MHQKIDLFQAEFFVGLHFQFAFFGCILSHYFYKVNEKKNGGNFRARQVVPTFYKIKIIADLIQTIPELGYLPSLSLWMYKIPYFCKKYYIDIRFVKQD